MAVEWKKIAYAGDLHDAVTLALDSDPALELVGQELKLTLTGEGLFEIDVDGGLMPITAIQTDNYFELDGNDDVMPRAA